MDCLLAPGCGGQVVADQVGCGWAALTVGGVAAATRARQRSGSAPAQAAAKSSKHLPGTVQGWLSVLVQRGGKDCC